MSPRSSSSPPFQALRAVASAPPPPLAEDPRPRRAGARRLLDALAFSSLLASAIGMALTLVASRALEAPAALRAAILVGSGSFVIYNLDRLRDIERDHRSAPVRTAFIEAHRRILCGAVAAAGLVLAVVLWKSSFAIQMLCVGVGGVGLLHRRMKSHPILKTGYVSIAWVVACVGIPWLAAGRPPEALWLAGSLLAVLAANLIASSLRDAEIRAARVDVMRGVALLATSVAMVLALLSPGRLGVVAWIALLECLALAGYRADERYGLVVVDGALLAGSLIAWLHLGWLEAG